MQLDLARNERRGEMCPSMVLVMHTKDHQRLRDPRSLDSKKNAQKKAGNVHFEQIPATRDMARGGAP